MIINLLALLVILAAGAVAGILFIIRYAEHRHAKREADEDRLSSIRELLAPQASTRNDGPGRHKPSARDSRDRLPI